LLNDKKSSYEDNHTRDVLIAHDTVSRGARLSGPQMPGRLSGIYMPGRPVRPPGIRPLMSSPGGYGGYAQWFIIFFVSE